MPLHAIHSIDDPRIEPYRSLKTTNRTRHTGEFIVEGENLIERMILFAWPIDSVLVIESRMRYWQARLPESVELYFASPEILHSIVGFPFHRGALACARRPTSLGIDRLPLAGTDPALFVVCVDIHDPENIGSILRTSRAFGVAGVLLTDRCADPFSRRVIRTSTGAALSVPMAVTENLDADLTRLRESSIELTAASIDPKATPLDRFQIPKKTAILLGNEGTGLSQSIQNECEHRITIPMSIGADSLNVAVAAGILLNQLTKDSPERKDRRH